jgi:hypothetical protein
MLLPASLLLAAGPVMAQEAAAGEPTIAYEREVFQYARAQRPDPFRSLLTDGDLGLRLEDLVLRGVVYHSDPLRSVAFLMVQGSERRIQARQGERVGTLRILGIHADRVEVVVEEFGVSRRETLHIEIPRAERGE